MLAGGYLLRHTDPAGSEQPFEDAWPSPSALRGWRRDVATLLELGASGDSAFVAVLAHTQSSCA